MKKLSTLFLFMVLAACSRQSNVIVVEGEALRPLTAAERNQDFDTLSYLFGTYYGPYQYKESLLGIKIDDVLSQARTAALSAKTDEEFAGHVMRFGAALKDGHVQITVDNSSSGILAYKIPIVLTPVEGKALIGSITPELTKYSELEMGDEVLEVDGKPVNDIRDAALRYKAFATDISAQHAVIYAFSRRSFMTEIVPVNSVARVKAKKVDGRELTIDIPWEVVKYNPEVGSLVGGYSAPIDLRVPFAEDINSLGQSHIGQMGSVEPFFLSPSVQAKYKFVKVYPSDSMRKKFGLKEDQKPPIYAALYKHGGKTIFLMREASYSQDDYEGEVYLKAYMALIEEYQDLADVMVLDQTHNPGGSYCAEFYNLFARPGDLQGAEDVRADRKWINGFKILWPKSVDRTAFGGWDAKLLETWGLNVEKAYDEGRFLADPVPLFTGNFYAQKQKATWTKPMLVLIDELAGSCGDMFPMLVKANQRAVLFGQTTMGLGGNVEEVGILPNSRIRVRMTRGLFYPYHPDRAPLASEIIENNGVSPDISYAHTVSDFRGGFVNYVETFSDRALEQIK